MRKIMHKTIQKFVLNLIIICKSCLNFCATITNGHSLWAHERHKILYKNIHRSIIFINWSSKNPQFAFSNSFNKKIPWMICLNRNFHITRYFWLFGPKITSTPQKPSFPRRSAAEKILRSACQFLFVLGRFIWRKILIFLLEIHIGI